MVEIKDLLSKFNNILLSEDFKKKTILNVISEIINIELKKEDIKIINNIIYLNIKPIYKNEIFIKKEKIFLMLKDILNKKTPKDLI